jgi:hypothetical protein
MLRRSAINIPKKVMETLKKSFVDRINESKDVIDSASGRK